MERNKENQVSEDVAHKLALTKIALMFSNIIKNEKRKSKWASAIVKKEALKIFDLNGLLLFYEFDIVSGKQVIGRIKASANKTLGPAVWTMQKGPRKWDPDKALKTVVERFEKEYKTEPDEVKLVCYSYPKIGALATKKTEKGLSIYLLIDAASYARLATEKVDKEGIIGSRVWSVYNKISEKEKLDRIRRWERDQELIGGFQVTVDTSYTLMEVAQAYEAVVVDLAYLISVNTKRLNLTQYGQEHCVWCADASGQMILRYHHYYYEQPDIVDAMNTLWDPDSCPWWHGTTYGGLVTGMEDLSRNYLDATQQETSWNDAYNEIVADRPFFSVVPGHARVCDGYQTILWLFPIFHFYKDRYLYILDPWPVGENNNFCNPDGGDEYWEDYDAVEEYWDMVTIRPCTGTMTCEE